MPAFAGFRAGDFDDIAGTTWRGRQRLGGVLSEVLSDVDNPFRSWGVRRRLEVHIACPRNYDFDDPFPSAKLFVESNGVIGEELQYGLYLELPRADDPKVKRHNHWRNFRDRICGRGEMLSRLRSAMTEQSLSVRWYEDRKIACQHNCVGGRLYISKTDKEVPFEELIERVGEYPKDRYLDFYVLGSMKKESALAMGNAVSEAIARVLASLRPIYLMTIA